MKSDAIEVSSLTLLHGEEPLNQWMARVQEYWSNKTSSDCCEWVCESNPGNEGAQSSLCDRLRGTANKAGVHQLDNQTQAWPMSDGYWLVCHNGSMPADDELHTTWLQLRSQWPLRSRLEKAERSAAFEHWLLSSVSHDLRSPLSSIISFLSLLEDTQTDWRSQLPIVQQESHRLHRLINQLLDFSRLQANCLELAPKSVNLMQWVSSVVNVWRGRALEKGVYFRLYLADNLPHQAQLDDERLYQIVHNLISNALKFTVQGSVELAILRLDNPDELVFEVTDTGPGIDPNKRALLFEPFRQTRQEDQFTEGGVGLGLNIVKQLTNLMQGRVEVSSEPGKGSVFRVTLPLIPIQDTDQTVSLPTQQQANAIVIDEDTRSARTLSLQLALLAIATQQFQTGPEALFQLRQSPRLPDWVFISASLTGIGARQTLAELAKQLGVSTEELTERTFWLTSKLERPYANERFLTLPATQDELEQALTFAESPVPTEPAKQPTVLVVDDTDLNRQLTRIQLEKLNLHVITASSGQEALARLDNRPIDLVLMDIMMPDMDGYETTALIRQRPTGRSLPIIALTANALFSDPAKCRDAGMDDYLSKPYRPDQLSSLVQRYLPGWKRPPMTAAPGNTKPPPEAADNEAMLVDWPKALDMVGGDEPILMTILAPFIDDLPATVEALQALQAEQDWAGLQRRAHSLKGMLRTFGAMPLGQAAYELEQAAGEHSSEAVANAWQGFQSLYPKTLDWLNRYRQASPDE
ncbi:MAG: response regulator [Saccharospirillum sp.]